jgi:hypothetical protein
MNGGLDGTSGKPLLMTLPAPFPTCCNGKNMASSSVVAARALWDAGKPLEAGRVLFEATPEPARVGWAAAVLAMCCEYLQPTPQEIATVVAIARDKSQWPRAHGAFEAVRRLTLRVERGDVQATDVLRGTLYVAENTAKVVYNASLPNDPFDADAGWWIVANVQWIAARVSDRAFRERVWRLLSDALLSAPNGKS